MKRTTTFISLAAVYILGLPAISLSYLTSYDCSSTTHVQQDVHINDLPLKCDTIKKSETVWVDIVELKDPTILIYGCKVAFTQVVVGVSGKTQNVTNGNGTEIIGREACLQAHKTGYITLAGKLTGLGNTNGTNIRTVRFEDSDIIDILNNHEHHYTRTYEITLVKNLATVYIPENIISFDNGGYCDYDDYTCEDELHGRFYWEDIKTKSESLIYRTKITYYTIEQTLINPEVRYAMYSNVLGFGNKMFVMIAFGNFLINNRRAFQTEFPNVYIIDSEKRFLLGSSMGSPYDKRLKGIYQYTKPMFSKGIDPADIIRTRCKTGNQFHLWFLKSWSSTIKVMFMQKGILGTSTIKDHFMIERCEKKKVVVKRNGCSLYRLLPVRDMKNRSEFLDPLTRFIYNYEDEHHGKCAATRDSLRLGNPKFELFKVEPFPTKLKENRKKRVNESLWFSTNSTFLTGFNASTNDMLSRELDESFLAANGTTIDIGKESLNKSATESFNRIQVDSFVPVAKSTKDSFSENSLGDYVKALKIENSTENLVESNDEGFPMKDFHAYSLGNYSTENEGIVENSVVNFLVPAVESGNTSVNKTVSKHVNVMTLDERNFDENSENLSESLDEKSSENFDENSSENFDGSTTEISSASTIQNTLVDVDDNSFENSTTENPLFTLESFLVGSENESMDENSTENFSTSTFIGDVSSVTENFNSSTYNGFISSSNTSTRESFVSTTLETSVVTNSTENAASTSQSFFDSFRNDWIKILGLVSLCVWAFFVIARMFKLAAFCVCKRREIKASRYENIKLNVAALLSIRTVVDLLRPPFIEKCVYKNRRRVTAEKIVEPSVSYIAH